MRQSIRLAGTALAASLALLATGCGSSDDGESADDQSNEAADSETAEDAESEDDGTPDPGLPGAWGDSGSTPSVLHVGSDNVAALVLESEVCLGAATSSAGQDILTVQCVESTDFGTGHASVEGDTLTVQWEGGTNSSYERLADVGVDLSELPLEEFDLDALQDFDPGDINIDDLDLAELEDLLPPDGSIDLEGLEEGLEEAILEELEAATAG